MRAALNQKGRRAGALVLLFLLGLGVRSFRAWQEVIANPDVMRFVAQMHGLARDPAGTMRTEVYHPLHAAVALLVHTLAGGLFADERMGWIWSLRIVGIVAGSFLAVQIVRLARWFGAPFWAGWAAGVVWIVGRRTSIYGSDGLCDMLAWTLFMESILQALPALRTRQQPPGRGRTAGRMALAGALAGLAYLTRPEGAAAVIIIAVTLLLLVTCRQKRGGRNFKVFPRRRMAFQRAALAGICLTAAFLVPALPYMVTIGGFTGKKTLLVHADEAAAPVAEAPPNGSRLEIAVPGTLAATPNLSAVWKVTKELHETFSWAPWLALLLACPLMPRLWGRPRLRLLAIVWILLWDAVMYWLIHRAGYLDGRHTLPTVLLLHILFALALTAWTHPISWYRSWWRKDAARWAALPAWRRWREWPRVMALIVFLLVITPGVILLGQPPRSDKQYLRDAADYIRADVRPGVVICDRNRLVGYYSGHPYAQWYGLQKPRADDPQLDDIQRIRQAHGNMPVILGKVYLPAEETLRTEIGPYREIRRFASVGARNNEVYVLYALPDENWRK